MKRLHQVAINDDGFVFDPVTGDSFTLNRTGLLILKGFKENKSRTDIEKEFLEEFEIDPETVEKDINDFTAQLRTYQLL